MDNNFVNTLMENLADVVTMLILVGIVAAGILFWRARRRHLRRLRANVRGELALDNRMKAALAKIFNLDTAEVATIGTVTMVDIAWHYSMADPHIWDHFNGPGADHLADAIQNLDVLKSSLGDASTPLAENILNYFRGLEATQLFHELTDKLTAMDAATGSGAIVLDAKSTSLVDALADQADVAVDAKSMVVSKAAGLLVHVPMVTIGFASYRAWKRSQRGTGLKRNVEFATIEVTTRAGGGLVGGQLGGAIGTAIVPGVGTVIGGVAGAIAGAVGGALLGEELKSRHINKARDTLDKSLIELGKPHLVEPDKFVNLKEVFVEQERLYTTNLLETRRRMRRYALLPWRIIWPNEKMILLQETVKLAEDRLGEIKQGTIDAVERLHFMRETAQYRQMGIILWSDPALCQQITCERERVQMVADANEHLRRELTQLGRLPAGSMVMN